MVGGAGISKLLGFWRDRLITDIFPAAKTDVIFLALKIPDFFYYVFVGATLSTIFIPRYCRIKEKISQENFLSSFWWMNFFVFAIIVLFGVLTLPWTAKWLTYGLDESLQQSVLSLSYWCFASTFVLALGGFFAAFLQAKQKFRLLALLPIIYMGSVVFGIFNWGDIGLWIVGASLLGGGLLYFLIGFAFFLYFRGKITWQWLSPPKEWKGFIGDWTRRILNNIGFQLNEVIDLWIAGLLVLGSVTAFSLGNLLGGFLLSIVGVPLSNVAFSKFSREKSYTATLPVFYKTVGSILLITLPFAVLGFIFSAEIITLLFSSLSNENTYRAGLVLRWTIFSLPISCLIVVFSRIFLSQGDTVLPLKINIMSLFFGSSLAFYLGFYYFPPEIGELGIAIGTSFVNYFSLLLFAIFLAKKIRKER